MTLDEFLASMPAQAEAFRRSTLEHAKTDDGFVLEREEIDWWREIAAYVEYVEVQEMVRESGT